MVNHVDRGKENVTSICVFENNVSGELCLEKKKFTIHWPRYCFQRLLHLRRLCTQKISPVLTSDASISVKDAYMS